jgi:hypothetical protein
MARFTVRVELHGAEGKEDTYSKLHKEMAKKGFSREIEIDEITYELPPAEYNWTGDSDPDEVLKHAKAAASIVWKTFSVLVTKAEPNLSRKQYGLKVVKKE